MNSHNFLRKPAWAVGAIQDFIKFNKYTLQIRIKKLIGLSEGANR